MEYRWLSFWENDFVDFFFVFLYDKIVSWESVCCTPAVCEKKTGLVDGYLLNGKRGWNEDKGMPDL